MTLETGAKLAVRRGWREERSDEAANIAPSQRRAVRSDATVLHKQLFFCGLALVLLVAVALSKPFRLVASLLATPYTYEGTGGWHRLRLALTS